MSGMPLRMKLLLALLSGEGSALELAERITGEQDIIPAGIYETLRAMEDDGFVSVRASEPVAERGNRPRYYYCITPAGRKALLLWRPESTPPILTLFLWLMVATCASGALAAVGITWAGPLSALLFCLLSVVAVVALWRLP